MKCPECDGYKNFVSLAGTPFEVVKPCKRCNGTGEIEMTEQEYIQTCNTEQLAEVFIAICRDAFKAENYRRNHWSDLQTIEFWKRWLKQPHHDEVEK